LFAPKKAVAFFKKSDAKKFLIPLGYSGPTGTAPEDSKVFCFPRPDD
jgi:hypothetical protein